ncbi:hypothetical protein SLV14_000981 [Streptomyces sp. Je 1-4]|uniref:hypothetical protein n=1 Tax=Streptomyces TaxID=1883 RepID=UPI000D21D900|nr:MULTISPECIES: hypothetical protein [unclassified Streptomyces]AVT42375.1 PumF [Streptomyces sp.]UYB38600.1 hypothetical protein SLV14_000981 [Streptomyces sp. Je 1-4]UZQ34568.1 hypothetical protein SLV14N_000981 [Streptomyces sp. Je 1-4] [Streptomyces sp. Je 1-4 4N24]UZQ41986.1 hypothetical protein SLV14NA_000981 [Streptomyces sp. Je 1-4] [Streptomyces sp. Je 1-4 4N24_ara]
MWNVTLQFSGWLTGDSTPSGTARRHELTEDEQVVIRYDPDTDSLGFSSATRPQPAGVAVVTAHGDHWSLTNLHAEDTYFVENMEVGGEFVKVAPRRQDIPIPFELARLILPVPRGTGVVNVFGPEPRFLDASFAADRTTNWPRLDERCLYFRVLVALCEPQLRGGPPGAVPTVMEVIARLGGRFSQRMSRAAVNHHIDYLATHKLRVSEWAGACDGKRSYWKREAIVAMALRSGLVNEAHLELLPHRQVTGPQEPAPSSAPAPRSRSGR